MTYIEKWHFKINYIITLNIHKILKNCYHIYTIRNTYILYNTNKLSLFIISKLKSAYFF